MATILAVFNQKGGVGKTTTTRNLAYAAAELGRKVLAVDFDPQANLTKSLTEGYAPADGEPTLVEALDDPAKAPVRSVIVPSVDERIDVLPSPGASLATVEGGLWANVPGRESRLREALETVADRYDATVIDTGPNIGLLLLNALTAADVAVAVLRPDEYSTHGLREGIESVERIQRYYNPHLVVAGAVVNLNENTSIVEQRRTEMQAWLDHFGIPVLGRPIQKTTQVERASAAQVSLTEYGTVAMRELGNVFQDIYKTAEKARRRAE